MPRNWLFISWFGQQTRRSSGFWTCLFFFLLLWLPKLRERCMPKHSYFHSPMKQRSKSDYRLQFYQCFLITMHWEHYLKHCYNASMVAHTCCGCWCSRLVRAFAARLNGIQITIWASPWDSGPVTKTQASLCNSGWPITWYAIGNLTFLCMFSPRLKVCQTFFRGGFDRFQKRHWVQSTPALQWIILSLTDFNVNV